ncbi:MAG: bifunctional oligoribonuclease/PAP phosphatase NrnA [Gemmatimonadota bacterium]
MTTARDVVLTTHVNPDGDGLGAEAALGAWLHGAGARVRILNDGPPPRAFAFLASPAVPLGVFRGFEEDGLAAADAVVVVDAPAGPRLGAIAEALPRMRARRVRIDHHAGREPAGELELVDPGASSTAELVFRMLDALAVPVTAAIAAPLYAGISFDTGSFRYGNTTRITHLVAAELHRRGVRAEELYARMVATSSLERLRLWGSALSSLRLECGGRLAWTCVDDETLRTCGAAPEDLDGLAEQGRRVAGVAISVLFREDGPEETKVSFRSTPPADVHALAARLGGGGHVSASGATLALPLAAAIERVLGEARSALGCEADPPARTGGGPA